MFFDEKGMLNMDEWIADHPSFKRIMEDGLVSEEEIRSQAETVISQLQDMEKKYSKEQLAEVKNLLGELSVLYAVYHYFSIQNLNQ